MEIYIVQQDDNIYLIAERFKVDANRLIQDNGLIYPYNLVIGQAIVIAYPKQSHVVQQGDTLDNIATAYNVTLMQLLRNNPHLSDRDYLYPGETLVISYNTLGSTTINGFTYPYISQEALTKILPNLTYLSIFNYTSTEKGEVIAYQDDSQIVQTAKEYSVIPLLMIASLSLLGEPNIETAFSILLSEEYQENTINQFLTIMKNKGYLGFNIVFNYINENNQSIYETFINKISDRLRQEGFLFFITINYNLQNINNEISFEYVNYSRLSRYVNGLIFLQLVWGTNYGPPSPVSNFNNVKALIDYVASEVSPDKIIVGQPFLGYDWQLPYVPDKSSASSLTINSVLDLAYDVNAIIQFDEDSQTPFFYYNQFNIGAPSEHIVWFIDARSITALNKLIIEYSVGGSGIWNIMIYYPQLWTIINSEFDILKLL